MQGIHNLWLRIDTPSYHIRFYHKILFCIIIGLVSFFFSETISGSSPLLFDTFPLFYKLPLHTFHTLVFGFIVLKATDHRPTFAAIFVAGGIYGLYEAYITKELWYPTWSADYTFKIGGVSVVHTLILCFFFHNVCSFFVPLLLCEALLTNLGPKPIMDTLPPRFKYIFENRRNSSAVLLIIFAIWAGMFSSNGHHDHPEIVARSIATIVLIGLLIALWRYLIRNKEVTLQDIFPQQVGFIISLTLLIAVYVFGILFVRTEFLPTIVKGQLIIWLLYFLFLVTFTFIAINIQLQEVVKPLIPEEHNTTGNYSTFHKVVPQPLRFSWVLFTILSVVFVGISITSSFAEPFIMIPILISLVIASVVGVFLFAAGVNQAVAGARLLWQLKIRSPLSADKSFSAF